MRLSFASLALALSAVSIASPALALTSEPNGTQIPRDSMNGEVQLYTLFQQLGEPIDWLADANTTPDTFSPLCSFTAKYVLSQAGNHFGLAWYNATNSPPLPADLHQIMPPNSPVGTVILSSDIKSDPAYQGGLIGFALIGGQTHYSQKQWDPVCSGCNPPAPWIGAVVYASKVTPDAYYLAFEDGSFGPNPGDFSNDGDFNDDVFFLTGLTCAGGGQPCDTGKPGICGPGLTQCTPNGVTCTELTPAAPKETCNGLDDDCNGMTDEGDPCPASFVCDKGTCVQMCGGGEFTCAGGLICNAGYCVDPKCAMVTCPSGQVCVGGACKAPCDGITCPYPEVCRVGACVDPCAGVMCPMGQVCDEGVCIQSCQCAPCSMSKACDMASGSCVDAMCVGTSCPSGQHCAAGACVDNCAGAVCPVDQICKMGACVKDPNGATSSAGNGVGGSSFVGAGGSNMEPSGGGVGGAGHGGASSGTNGLGGDRGVVIEASGDNGGCGCRVGEGGGTPLGLFAGLGAVAFVIARRRRRGVDAR